MVKEGAISFSYEKRAFFFLPERMSGAHSKSSGLALLSQKLLRLPEKTVALLKKAACLGRVFSIASLKKIFQLDLRESIDQMMTLVHEQILIPLQGDLYGLSLLSQSKDPSEHDVELQFIHDKYIEATLDLLTPSERADFHYTIGTHLMKDEADALDIVFHLNQCQEKFISHKGTYKLVYYNWQAAKIAKTSSALKEALRFIDQGLSVLSQSKSGGYEHLLFELKFLAIEIDYMRGELTAAGEKIDDCQKNAKTPTEKAKLLKMKSWLLGAQGFGVQAVDLAYEALGLLGVALTKNPSTSYVYELVQRTLKRIDRGDLKPLLEKSRLLENKTHVQNEKLELIVHLLAVSNANFVARGRFNDYFYGSLVRINLHMDQNMVTGISRALLGFSACLSGFYSYKKAQAFAQRGLQLNLTKMDRCGTLSIYGLMIEGWVAPWEHTALTMRDGWLTGRSIGDTFVSGICAAFAIRWYSRNDFKKHHQFAEDILQSSSFIHPTYALLAKEYYKDSKILSEEPIDPFDFKSLLQETSFTKAVKSPDEDLLLSLYYSSKMEVLFLFQRYDLVYELYQRIKAKKALFINFIEYSYVRMIYFLARTIPLANHRYWFKIPKDLEDILALVHTWQKHSPTNHLPFYHLMLGEKARLLGRGDQTFSHYQKALSLITKSARIYYEALFFEVIANFFAKSDNGEFNT